MEFSPKFNVPDQQEVERERGVISFPCCLWDNYDTVIHFNANSQPNQALNFSSGDQFFIIIIIIFLWMIINSKIIVIYQYIYIYSQSRANLLDMGNSEHFCSQLRTNPRTPH